MAKRRSAGLSRSALCKASLMVGAAVIALGAGLYGDAASAESDPRHYPLSYTFGKPPAQTAAQTAPRAEVDGRRDLDEEAPLASPAIDESLADASGESAAEARPVERHRDAIRQQLAQTGYTQDYTQGSNPEPLVGPLPDASRIGAPTPGSAADERRFADPDPERGETVRNRARPEWDPIGLPVSSFFFYPRLEIGEEFDDNIFREDSGEEADFITLIRPRLRIESDWSRHALTFDADAEIARYAFNEAEDYEDARVGLAGRLDVTSDTYLGAGANYQMLHEDRGSPDDAGGEEPTLYDVTTGNLQAYHRFGRFNISGDGQVEMIDYDDSDATTAGGVMVEINNDDRDRMVYSTSARLGYEIQPEYEAFVRGVGNWRDYDSSTDDLGFDRDSEGYAVHAGIDIDFGGLIFGEFFAGWSEQYYVDPGLPDISGADFGADLTWNVTPLTTITAFGNRTIEETTVTGASGFFANRFGVGADHELLRNLLIFLDAGYQLNDYEGITREDDIYSAGAEVRYLLNRNVYLSGRYGFQYRDSTVDTSDFVDNRGLVTIGLQY